MDFPRAKQEPDDGRVSLALPEGKKEGRAGGLPPLSDDVKPVPGTHSYELPLRPLRSSTRRTSREPGEVSPSPSPRPSRSRGTPRKSDRYIDSGPIPAQGTPQDRFLQAMVGLDEKERVGGPAASCRDPAIPVGPRNRGPVVFGGAPQPINPRSGGLVGFGDSALTFNNGGRSMALGWGHNVGGAFQPALTGANNLPVVAPKLPPKEDKYVTTGFGRLYPGQSNPIQVLSRECQKRHFNPQWYGNETTTGKFTCNVRLGNKLVNGDGQFDDAMAAKVAVAEKALRVVRSRGFKVELEVPPQRSQARVAEAANILMQSGQNLTPARHQHLPAIKQEEDDAIMTDISSEATAPLPHRRHTPNTTNREEADRAALLEQVHQVTGIALPEAARNNPDVARAFLEGLSAGARLSGSSSTSAGPSSTPRARSRSPSDARHSSRSYRDRSTSGHPNERSTPAYRHQEEHTSGRRGSDHYKPKGSKPAGRNDRYRPNYGHGSEDDYGCLKREE